MLQTLIFTAGETKEFYDIGDFFRVLDATDPITVIFYKNGKEVGEAENVYDGYAEKFRLGGFDRYRITSATAQSVQIVARDGVDVAYDKQPEGTVQVTNWQGAFSQAQATVTTASAQLFAAKAARRYLLIQNNDASGIVYVTLNGAAATAANGFQVQPGGGVLELSAFVPPGQINAIGSIASNANVVIAEA